jgi:hypothetical protein
MFTVFVFFFRRMIFVVFGQASRIGSFRRKDVPKKVALAKAHGHL